jgi:hypothetical protein
VQAGLPLAAVAATQADTCAACGGSSPNGAPLNVCSLCKAVSYCGSQCQRTHWPVHKTSCTAAAVGRSGQASSSTSPSARIIGLSTEERAVQAAPSLAAEAAGATQQTEPETAGGGGTKNEKELEKEKLRKERQRQRKVEEAWEALQGAIETMKETAGSVDAVQEARQRNMHASRSEKLAALVTEARGTVEQARAAEVERAREAAEEAAAAEAVKTVAKAAAAAERLQAEEEVAALTLRLQEAQQRLGSVMRVPADAKEDPSVPCVP